MKETVYTQLIAHDKEVYDISFSPDRNIFASVGGMLKLFLFIFIPGIWILADGSAR